MSAEFTPVMPAEELAEGALAGVTVRGEPVCLANAGGRLFAVGDVCTHAEFSMHEGFVTGGCRIECAWHGAMYDLATGAVVRSPADEPLPVYEVRVRGGMIEVGRRIPATEAA